MSEASHLHIALDFSPPLEFMNVSCATIDHFINLEQSTCFNIAERELLHGWQKTGSEVSPSTFQHPVLLRLSTPAQSCHQAGGGFV